MRNSTGKFLYKIKQAQIDADTSRNHPAIIAKPAFLGDNDGVLNVLNGIVLPENYIVVRDENGNLSSAFNDCAPAIPNLPVTVGYEPVLRPTLFQVLAVRDYIQGDATVALKYHHKIHEWDSPDTVFIYSEQYLPGLLFANNGFTINIYPMMYRKINGEFGYLPYQTIDLSSYVPTSGATAYTILFDDDAVIYIVAGQTKGSYGLLTPDCFYSTDNNTLHTLWGVKLYNGQTQITMTSEKMDVIDLRFGGGNGGGHIILDQNGDKMPQRSNLKIYGNIIYTEDDSTNNMTLIFVDEIISIKEDLTEQIDGIKMHFDLSFATKNIPNIYCNILQRPSEVIVDSNGLGFTLSFSPTIYDCLFAEYEILKSNLLLDNNGNIIIDGNGNYIFA